MSEINKEQNKASQTPTNDSETTVRIEIDNDRRLTELQKENQVLAAKNAVMEYEKKHNSFGAPNAPLGDPTQTAPLNPSTDDFKPLSGSLFDRGFESEESMYREVSVIAHNPSHPNFREAVEAERALWNKFRREGPIDFEYQGMVDKKGNFSTKALFKQPIEINPNWTAEQKQVAKTYNSELAKAKNQWRKVQ